MHSDNPQVQYRILDERLREFPPTYATPGSAAFDLRAALDKPLVLEPGEAELVPTGLAVWIGNKKWAGMILPRSGTGHKRGIVLGNSTGLIDADYQGVLLMSLCNRSRSPVMIEPLERVAQFVIVPVIHPEFVEVATFTDATVRGAGGIGHSGTR